MEVTVPVTHINIERLLRESPIPIDRTSIDEVHQRVFQRPKREAPDHYELHEELGRGQFGRVHRATDTRFPREVALKLIPYRGARQLARLEREAHALAKLAHPNIVSVFDKGIADVGNYFIATELVPGTRLDAWMADPSRKRDEILEVFAQAAEGLHHAHQRGLIHRDFKPANAIVDQSGRLRILDFGLAKLFEDDPGDSRVETEATQPSGRPPLASDEAFAVGSLTASSDWSEDPDEGDAVDEDLSFLTDEEEPDASHRPPRPAPDEDLSFLTYGHVIGTPQYASPEQLGGRKVDPRSDQFSLCVALFEACHGFHPFSGRTSIELVESIEAKAVARGRARWKIPTWLKSLLDRGLSPKPEDRFESTGEIAKILREHLRPQSRLGVGFAAGVLLTVALGGGLGAWHQRLPGALQGAVWSAEVEEKLRPHGPGVRESFHDYATALEDQVDAFRTSLARDPAAEACLIAGRQRFDELVDRVHESVPTDTTVPEPLTKERIWLDVLFDPARCMQPEPQWEEDSEWVDVVLDAQARRIAGDAKGAVKQLEGFVDQVDQIAFEQRELFFYELGTAQMHLDDPGALSSLHKAVVFSGRDQELLANTLYRQLLATATLQDNPDAQLALILDDLESTDASSASLPLARAVVASRRGEWDEVKRHYAQARDAFAALEEGDYRDYMMAHSTLNEVYAESNKESPDIDAETLVQALETVRTVLGATHPQYLQHGLRVARLLRERGEEEELDRATQVLDRLSASFDRDPNGSPGFHVLKLRTEALILAVQRDGERADGATKAAWIARANEIRNALESLPPALAEGRKRDAREVEVLLFFTYVHSDALASALRLLEDMAKSEDVPRKDEACRCLEEDFTSYIQEKKIQPTGDVLEIAARIRTLCKG